MKIECSSASCAATAKIFQMNFPSEAAKAEESAIAVAIEENMRDRKSSCEETRRVMFPMRDFS